MAYSDGRDGVVDWTAPLRAAELATAKATAKQADENGWAWRRHAEGLNKRCVEALKGQHEALTQREAWKITAKQLWDRLFQGQNKGTEELFALAVKNKQMIDEKYPYTGPT